MGDVELKGVKSLRISAGAVGFHRYASEFLKAVQGLKENEGFSPVPFYLICRSLELSLKAFLLAKGVRMEELKKIGDKKKHGHDLEGALEKAILLGLDKLVSLSPQHTEEIKKANEYYANKGSEYFEYKKMMAYGDLPDISILTDVATLLVTKVESACYGRPYGHPLK